MRPPRTPTCSRRSRRRGGDGVGPGRLPGRHRVGTALDEALDERQRRVGDLAPAAVDRQRVAAARDLDDLGDAGLRCCCLYEAFAIAHGTVWSFSPEMISSGPRSGFFVSTFASVHGLRFAVAAWNSGSPGRRDGVGLVELLRLVLAHRVGERVAELLVGERDGAVAVAPGCASTGEADAARRSAAAARRGTAPGRSRPTPPTARGRR